MNIKYIFAAMAVAVGFSACDEYEDTESWDRVSEDQVYFATGLSSQINLSTASSSFDVVLNRSNNAGELVANLTSTSSSEVYTIPTSVTFADSSATAVLTIGYDPSKLVFDVYDTITITIDANLVNAYGYDSYTFKVGAPAPWTSLGMGTFTESFLFENSYEVEVQRNDLDPNLYRLVNPLDEAWQNERESFDAENVSGNQSEYIEFRILPAGSDFSGVTTTIDDLVYFKSYNTGYHYTDDGADVDAIAHHPSEFTSLNKEEDWSYSYVKQRGADGSVEIIYLAPFYYMDGVGGYNYTTEDGIVSFVMPGVVLSDYSATVTYAGRFTSVMGADYATAAVTFGEDVESIKVAMVPGFGIEDETVDMMEDGTIETQELTSDGQLSFTCDVTGTYTFVALVYGNGVQQKVVTKSFYFKTSSEVADTWVSLGTATYTDDYFASLYGLACSTYEVEVEVSETNPGKYRMVEPYGAAFPYNEFGYYDETTTHYIEINAVDPHHVYINFQNTGLDLGDGEVYTYSFAAYLMDMGATLEEVSNLGYCGTLNAGIITFPKNSLLSVLDGNDGPYYANANGGFKLVMPGATPGPIASNKLSIARSLTNNIKVNRSMKVSRNLQKLSF